MDTKSWFACSYNFSTVLSIHCSFYKKFLKLLYSAKFYACIWKNSIFIKTITTLRYRYGRCIYLLLINQFKLFSENEIESEKYLKYRTLIHGDPKHANFFFRRRRVSGDQEEKIEVGVIDFQWSGFGLAATGKEIFFTHDFEIIG